MLSHDMNVTPEPLQRIAFENRSSTGEFDEAAHHLASPAGDVGAPGEEPGASLSIKRSSLVSEVHQLISIAVEQLLYGFQGNRRFCQGRL